MGRSLNADIESMSFTQQRLRFIEVGALSHLTKLEAFWGYTGHLGIGIPNNVVHLIHPATSRDDEGRRFFDIGRTSPRGHAFGPEYFFSGINVYVV